MNYYDLNESYQAQFQEIKEEIVGSEELKKYLETEEEEDYQNLREAFEPKIDRLYSTVAQNDPLQLISFEEACLDVELEGLYLTRILGYSVLRGDYDERYKYTRPQNHFKEILLTICGSSNFDSLKKRIGQSIQMGFALSSDIWITNLINSIDNKKVRHFLQSQKLLKYRDLDTRTMFYNRYRKQFASLTFDSAFIPTNSEELKIYFGSLKKFLKNRVLGNVNNDSMLEPFEEMLLSPKMQDDVEMIELKIIYLMYFSEGREKGDEVGNSLLRNRKEDEEFKDKFFGIYVTYLDEEIAPWSPASDKNLFSRMHQGVDDAISSFANFVEVLHENGFIEQKTIDVVKTFYYQHEGVSVENECVRHMIFNYFKQFVGNLRPSEYGDWFDISKYYAPYMSIFTNEKFNKRLKDMSLRYVKRILKTYTDKRGRDYQDVKKFVTANFIEWKLLSKPEVTELFKTRRKKAPSQS